MVEIGNSQVLLPLAVGAPTDNSEWFFVSSPYTAHVSLEVELLLDTHIADARSIVG